MLARRKDERECTFVQPDADEPLPVWKPEAYGCSNHPAAQQWANAAWALSVLPALPVIIPMTTTAEEKA